MVELKEPSYCPDVRAGLPNHMHTYDWPAWSAEIAALISSINRNTQAIERLAAALEGETEKPHDKR